MLKVSKNNALIAIIWFIYFFMICINILNDVKINEIILICLNIVAFIALIVNIKKISTSKLILLSGMMVIVYYISMWINNAYSFAFTGIFPIIALLIGVIIAKVICQSSNDRNKLMLGISSVLTLIGLISIDMASCQLISTYLGLLIKWIAKVNYTFIGVFESGIRMKSIITNPNIFASLTSIAILLNIYLYEMKYKQKLVLGMLLINMVAFLYTFSLGASLVLIFCVVMYLIFNRKNDLINKIYLIGVTGVVALLCVAIGFKGMGKNDIISFLPLITLFIGYLIIQSLIPKRETFAEQVFPKLLKHKWLFLGVLLVCILCMFTMGKSIYFNDDNREKEISVSLGEGSHHISLEFDRYVNANIEIYGQTYEQASRREYDVLYSSDLEGENLEIDVFAYPNNKSINIKIYAFDDAMLKKVKIYDLFGHLEKNVTIDYMLIPNFIENRLSPFSYNQNAVQRFTFFIDGIKIWFQNPIIGNGPSAFINNFYKVKTSNYNTWSSHNFLIDILADVGILGFGLMIFLIIYIFSLIIKNRKSENREIILNLGIIYSFILLHSLIELTFLYIPYLITFGIVCGMIENESKKEMKNKYIVKFNAILPILILITNVSIIFIDLMKKFA